MNADEARQTAEMWFWRRTLKVHWTTRVKKFEMPRRRIATTIGNRQPRFLGHIVRKDELEYSAIFRENVGKKSKSV